MKHLSIIIIILSLSFCKHGSRSMQEIKDGFVGPGGIGKGLPLNGKLLKVNRRSEKIYSGTTSATFSESNGTKCFLNRLPKSEADWSIGVGSLLKITNAYVATRFFKTGETIEFEPNNSGRTYLEPFGDTRCSIRMESLFSAPQDNLYNIKISVECANMTGPKNADIGSCRKIYINGGFPARQHLNGTFSIEE
jgi:hypothetical protein